ncbi:MAG: RsmE family RNA methyltransferase [Polyangia bacterium]|jgi:RsmE family RNA methyltransferase|nr:RsmE family RNA methyltransferase [Polyangia bacterium]
MTMNLILLDPEDLRGGEARLTGRRAQHVLEVIRPSLGASLRVALVRGRVGTGRVLSLGADEVRLEVTLAGPPGTAAPRPPVDLVLAVPRPKVLLRVLGAAAAAGVGRIDLVNAWRVDKSYLASPALAPDRLEAALRRGAEQGATPWVPEVALHSRLMQYLDEVLPARRAREARLLLHPRAPRLLETALPPGTDSEVLAAVGPERGWIDREVETFEERGFASARLGEAVLDVAPAVSCLLGQLALLGRLPGRH